jgi:hypothetical protein
MPVLAIEARGLDEASTPDTGVEDMARHYLTRIKMVQAAGRATSCRIMTFRTMRFKSMLRKDKLSTSGRLRAALV